MKSLHKVVQVDTVKKMLAPNFRLLLVFQPRGRKEWVTEKLKLALIISCELKMKFTGLGILAVQAQTGLLKLHLKSKQLSTRSSSKNSLN